MEVEQFKAIPRSQYRLMRGSKIYSRFLSLGSPMCVCLPEDIKRELLNVFSTVEPPESAFNDAEASAD